MQREEKSGRSRQHILDAALQLFAHHGYRATSVREIAEAAGVSIGNVYHHFGDKESIFRTLLDDYAAIADSRRFPFVRAMGSGVFPDNLEQLGAAARESVRQFRDYFALIYVDVIEFDGTHIRRFYGEMPQRIASLLERSGSTDDVRKRLRPGVSPVSALLLASRLFFSYFSVEILFNVSEPFGKDSTETLREICELLRNGMT
jgi:AcrR family transcriptional regulator